MRVCDRWWHFPWNVTLGISWGSERRHPDPDAPGSQRGFNIWAALCCCPRAGRPVEPHYLCHGGRQWTSLAQNNTLKYLIYETRLMYSGPHVNCICHIFSIRRKVKKIIRNICWWIIEYLTWKSEILEIWNLFYVMPRKGLYRNMEVNWIIHTPQPTRRWLPTAHPARRASPPNPKFPVFGAV